MRVNERAYRAQNLRYKRAALSLIQRDRLEDELYEISSECSELEWAVDDDETLIDVFDGDTDEIHEFRFMFSDLAYKCERLSDALRDGYVTEHFDDFFVGTLGSGYKMVGFDSAQEDYFNLTRFEAELAQTVSGKRIAALKKDEIIAVAGQCIGIMMSFLDIRHQYDCLKATFDALRDDRAELLKGVHTVEDAYQKWQEDPGNMKLERKYDDLLLRLPGRIWVE
jgi:predicted nuclease with TOPRIM domain